MNNGVTVYVIDVSKAWNTNTPFHNFIPIEDLCSISFKRDSTVFDISKLSFRDKQLWVNNFVSSVYTEHLNGYDFKEFIIFEECHIYVPAGAMRSPSRFEPMINLITVGRNFTLRYALATQFPASASVRNAEVGGSNPPRSTPTFLNKNCYVNCQFQMFVFSNLKYRLNS